MRRGVSVLLGVVVLAITAGAAHAGGAATRATTYAPLRTSSLSAACVGAGAAAIVEPGRVLALGTPASALGASGYPSSGSIVAFASSTANGARCASSSVALASVSLFGGVVTASSVQATDGNGSVTGLSIDGTAVDATAGQTLAVQDWGQLTLGATAGRLRAPLLLTLLQPHGSLPAGSAVLIAFSATAAPVVKPKPKPKPATKHTASTSSGSHTSAAAPAHRRSGQPPAGKKKHKHRKAPASQPLTVTPPLGFDSSHYVFPVDGGASYVDTYGANRSDVSGGWHHGDDLFAPLGTPVVAVANGTLSLVGWNEVGGWRLWLTDEAGNSFYYAHLAGYSRWILSHPHVRAGQVVGFLGRTGDAFTTTPHLHFEVHPHQLFDLGYDGAVDPTIYLKAWRVVRVPAKEMPRPAKLKAPIGTPAEEAGVVWHQLLVARHLLPTASPAAIHRQSPGLPTIGSPRLLPLPDPMLSVADARPTAAAIPTARNDAPWIGGAGFAAVLVLGAGAFTLHRRRRSDAPPEIPSSDFSG